ncbi:hypothetical protein B0H11DRAFT_1920993 [Mycena galericulata]|nr:hypothetical protein B0H11DRAFT_1920993 [Mycena galericulata]
MANNLTFGAGDVMGACDGAVTEHKQRRRERRSTTGRYEGADEGVAATPEAGRLVEFEEEIVGITRKKASSQIYKLMHGESQAAVARKMTNLSQPTMSQPTQPIPGPVNLTPVSITPTRPTAPMAPVYLTQSIHTAHPSRPTCIAPYHPEPGVDRTAHSENAGTKFYVVGPGRVVGIYTDDKRATAQISGFRNGHMQGFSTWEEAQAAWAVVCRGHHGALCPAAPPVGSQRPPVTLQTRVELTSRARNPGMFWAVRGIDIIYESSVGAFEAALNAGLTDIQIRGSRDGAELEMFIVG